MPFTPFVDTRKRHDIGSTRDATTAPSAYWARELGIPTEDTQKEQLENLRSRYDELGIAKDTGPVLDNAAFNRDEIIEACRVDLNFLAAIAMPTTFVFEFPPTHTTAWQLLISGEQDKEEKFLQIALGIPRSHAKTTLIKLFVLWCILFSRRKFILLTASTLDRAIDILSDIADCLDEGNIKAVFGDWKINIEVDTKTLKKFGFRERGISF